MDSCETEAVPRAEAALSNSPTRDPVEVGLARTWPFERIPRLAWHGLHQRASDCLELPERLKRKSYMRAFSVSLAALVFGFLLTRGAWPVSR